MEGGGNLIWDVLKGQKALLDYTLGEGFESKAIVIECDEFWEGLKDKDQVEYGEDLLKDGSWTGSGLQT